MLDLSGLNNRYYDIKLLDGTELRLSRPTQSMIEFMAQMRKVALEDNELETIKALTTLFCKLLNHNIEGIKFKYEDIADTYDFTIINYVIEDYFEF